MKPQFQHQVVTSFALFLENVVMFKGAAFQNKDDANFYYTPDDRLDPNYMAFSSSHKQWVTDDHIKREHGANIIDGITLDGFYLKRGAQSVQYDFDNGRVLVPKAIASPSSVIQGSYAVKDFNMYITDQTEEELLLESQFDNNSRFDQIGQGIKPYDQVVPAIFMSYEGSKNVPFAFGGQDTTISNIRCVVFAEDSYQLDGLFSIINDLKYSNFANVGFNEHPLDEFGNLKNGNYDYKDLSDRYFDYSNFAYLNDIKVSKLNDRVAKKAHPGLYMGFIDAEIYAHRFPRQPLVEPVASRGPKIGYVPLAPYKLTLEVTQKPLAPYNIELDKRLPYNPYGLFLSTTRHLRLQAGNVANVVMQPSTELLIKLDGSPGQIAFLDIQGQSIQVGNSASNKLVFDGFTFSSVGQTIQKTIAGISFDITWEGYGSQIIKLKRAESGTGSFDSQIDVAIYVPC